MAKRIPIDLLASTTAKETVQLAGTAELQNFYLESMPPDNTGRAAVHAIGSPGSSLYYTFSALTYCRRAIEHKGLVYIAIDNTLRKFTPPSTDANLGAITGSPARCSMCALNDEVIVCDGTSAYSYKVTANTFATISSGLPGSVSHVVANDQYVLFATKNSNTAVNCAVSDARTVSALDVFTFTADKGNIVSMGAIPGYFFIFGETAAEIRYNNGQAVGPFSQVLSGGVIPVGCAAQHSVLNILDQIYFLARDRNGILGVMTTVGPGMPTLVSKPNFVSEVNGYSVTSNAYAWSHTIDGHIFYNLTFPSARPVSSVITDYIGETWSLDVASGIWSKLSSYNDTLQTQTQHRAIDNVYVSGMQLIADYNTARLLELSPDVFTDDGNNIHGEIITPLIGANGNPLSIYNLRIAVEPSKGAIGATPKLVLQTSKDGGHTYGQEMWRTVSEDGKYNQMAFFSSLGYTREFMNFKLTMTDPIKKVILHATADVELSDEG